MTARLEPDYTWKEYIRSLTGTPGKYNLHIPRSITYPVLQETLDAQFYTAPVTDALRLPPGHTFTVLRDELEEQIRRLQVMGYNQSAEVVKKRLSALYAIEMMKHEYDNRDHVYDSI